MLVVNSSRLIRTWVKLRQTCGESGIFAVSQRINGQRQTMAVKDRARWKQTRVLITERLCPVVGSRVEGQIVIAHMVFRSSLTTKSISVASRTCSTDTSGAISDRTGRASSGPFLSKSNTAISVMTRSTVSTVNSTQPNNQPRTTQQMVHHHLQKICTTTLSTQVCTAITQMTGFLQNHSHATSFLVLTDSLSRQR